MKTLFRFFLACILMIGATAVVTAPQHAAFGQDDISPMLIDFVAHSPEFIEWLQAYPNYIGNAWVAYDDVWYVEFYDEWWDEWLGYANIDSQTGEILEQFVPRPLPPDEFTRQQARIERLLFDDPEVIALIFDPALWEYSIDYNRWEQTWEAYFWRGVESWTVKLWLDEEYNGFGVSAILDSNAMDEETAYQHNRDRAVELAYSAGGVDQALAGYDDWNVYADNQGGSRWSVTFVSGDDELFYALVDIASEIVLESAGG
jgi:hypothetical protein